jgi:uncharacterized membrane protein
MSRFKNYGLWIAVASLLFMILRDAGIEITKEKYDGYVNSILYLLILLGIINDPTNGKGFEDEIKRKSNNRHELY